MNTEKEINYKPHPLVEKKPKKKRLFIRIFSISFIVILVLLIAIRVALPYVLLNSINKKLERLPNYICVLKDLNVHLFDLSITIKGIEMTKRNGKIETPFFTSGDIHVSLESYELITTKVVVEDCILNLVKGKNKELSQLIIDDELITIFKEMPFSPNIFIVENAEIHFIEKHSSANIDLSVKNITIDGRNIANQNQSKDKYPSTVILEGDFEGGKLKANAKLNKQKKDPLINIVSSFSPIKITRIKNFLKIYADIEVDAGTLSATSIINVYDGRLDGFIDPVTKNLTFNKSFDKDEVKLGKRIKQRLLNTASKLLGREESKKIVTRIELHGTLGEVKVNIKDIIKVGLKEFFLVRNKKEKE